MLTALLSTPAAVSGPPPLRVAQLGSFTFPIVLVVIMVAALALYLWGVARVNRLQPRHPWSRQKTAAFIGAMVTTALSIFTFIGVYQTSLFWVHMVQHLMLIMVAAALLAASSPADLTWRATTGKAHQRVSRVLRSGPARFLDHPLVGFGLYGLVIPITHLTSFYNFALLHGSVQDAEHLLFLVVGYLFWRQIFGSEPGVHRMHPALRMGYLAVAVSVDTFVGLSLSSASHELFPAFTAQHRTWGPSLLADLHTGGVIMWVAGDTLMLVAMVPVVLIWLHYEERRAWRVDRELDAIMPSRAQPLGGA